MSFNLASILAQRHQVKSKIDGDHYKMDRSERLDLAIQIHALKLESSSYTRESCLKNTGGRKLDLYYSQTLNGPGGQPSKLQMFHLARNQQ